MTEHHVILRWPTKLSQPTTQTQSKSNPQNFPRPNSQIRFSANSIFTSPQISNLKIDSTARRSSTAIEGRGVNGVRRILWFWFFSKRTKRSKQPPQFFYFRLGVSYALFPSLCTLILTLMNLFLKIYSFRSLRRKE